MTRGSAVPDQISELLLKAGRTAGKFTERASTGLSVSHLYEPLACSSQQPTSACSKS